MIDQPGLEEFDLYDLTPLLALDEDIFFIGLSAIVFMILIAAILTHHQRKMAEIFQKKQGDEVLPAIMDELNQLCLEVQSMRTDMNANMIVVDEIRSKSLPGAGEQDQHKPTEA